MTRDRFVVLTAAPARTVWTVELAKLADTGVLPIEVVSCVSVDELAARVRSGRSHSAAFIDTATIGLDIDTVQQLTSSSTVVVGVESTPNVRLIDGVQHHLIAPLDPSVILELLERATNRIVLADRPIDIDLVNLEAAGDGTLICVVGTGGVGGSTTAAALAQGIATQSSSRVLLCDLARNGQQALLHDIGDVVPSIEDVCEAARTRLPAPGDLRASTFRIAERNYDLLLGLRKPANWVMVRPRTFESVLHALRSDWPVVVADITADFETEADTGARDVDDRTAMSRLPVQQADLVLAVGRPGVTGIHSLVRLLNDLDKLGSDPRRIVPVITNAPRSPRQRSELVKALQTLAKPGAHELASSPLFLSGRRLDTNAHDATPLPGALANSLAAAALRLLQAPTARTA